MPLHEWKTFTSKDALSDNIITWVFEEDSFSPIAKIKKDKQYSIINDHLGTPIEAYADDGKLILERTLNSNGKVLKETGFENFCSFLYQGQSYDSEIELAYNRFRYYDPEEGRYISQDPLRLTSGEPNFYAYVHDPNGWIDPFGLKSKTYGAYNSKDEAAKAVLKNANRRSIKKNIEFGGLIYEKNGKFYPTRPIEGTKTGFLPKKAVHLVPKDAKIVGDYHTHGAETPGFNSNVYSDADKLGHSMAPSGHSSYLGTPSDGFKKMEGGIVSNL